MDKGLEKILQKIEKESDLLCEGIINDAKKEALANFSETINAAKRESENKLEKMRQESEKQLEIAKKGFELNLRNNLLLAQNKYIDEIIEGGLERISNLDDEAFFGFTKKLLDKYALSSRGIIRFNEKDSLRIKSRLEEFAYQLVLGEPIDIDGGFILEYEDINVNCSLRSMLETIEQDLRQEIYQDLFRR